MTVSRKMTRLIFLCFVGILIAAPAQARRFRIFGIPTFGGGETIDLVYDLPNEETYVKDGKYLDVGFLNGRYKNGYVVYSGSRYYEIDSSEIAILTNVLGFDPTAKHRAQYTLEHADEIEKERLERAKKDQLIREGKLIERRPGELLSEFAERRSAFVARIRSESASATPPETNESPSPRPPGGGFSWGLILFVGLFFFARKLFSGAFARPKAAFSRGGALSSSPHLDTASFDQRVAQRLAQLEPGNQSEKEFSTTDESSSFGALSRPSGFGRKID
jgi:hypothetical protein